MCAKALYWWIVPWRTMTYIRCSEWLRRTLPVLVVTASSVVGQTASPERAVIKQYCVGCHNTKTKTAGLELDTLVAENVTQHPDTWEKVIRKLRARYMPP